MKKFTITAILLCFFYSLPAQEDMTKQYLSMDTGKRIIIYKARISLNNGEHALKGVLYDVNDSSVLVSSSLFKKDYSTGKFELSKINFRNIDLVKIHKKNSVGIGILIGAVAGFLVGGVIGYSQGDDPPGLFSLSAEDKAKTGGFLMAVGGAGLGALFGSIQIKIPINGSKENFNNNKSRLKKYTIR